MKNWYKMIREILPINMPTNQAACCHNCEHGDFCCCSVCENDPDLMVCNIIGKHVRRWGLCRKFKNKHKKD